MLEVYEGSMIYFMAPLAKQDEFYVPETQVEDENSEEEASDDESSMSEQEAVVQQPKSQGILRELSPDTEPDITPEKQEISLKPAVSQPAVAKDIKEKVTISKENPEDKAKTSSGIASSSAAAASTSASPNPSQGSAEVSGDSSSEVDTESYEVVKTEEVSNQN